MTDIPDPVFSINGYGPYSLGSSVMGIIQPGMQADVHSTTGDRKPCAGCNRFIDPDDEQLPVTCRRQSASSVSP